MVLVYEFGGDDIHPGDDWEYEVSYEERVEAIADFMAREYINDTIRKTKASKEQADKLRSSTKIVADILCSILKDYDMVDDEFEESFRDTITDYYEEEAYQAYKDYNN